MAQPVPAPPVRQPRDLEEEDAAAEEEEDLMAEFLEALAAELEEDAMAAVLTSVAEALIAVADRRLHRRPLPLSTYSYWLRRDRVSIRTNICLFCTYFFFKWSKF